MPNASQINRKPRTKLQPSTQELFDIRIRILALKYSVDTTGIANIDHARRIEHYIKSGEIKTSSQLCSAKS
ncbi:MAG: hypothetical protein FD166_2943 [Bacteroidetes bacterium]|nr:MAG: hypothetical protein FD166_2943 [Bacteroidota bacterium]